MGISCRLVHLLSTLYSLHFDASLFVCVCVGQLITNDKFKSVEHRVLARQVGPRISAACFFYPSTMNEYKLYGPLKEFVSENNPPIYKETDINEYLEYYRSKGLDGTSALPHFKLS